MATPANVGIVTTNLSPEELAEFVEAIDTGKAKQVPGSESVFAGSSGCRFDYKGRTYLINESYEVLDTVWLVPKGRTDEQCLAEMITARG